MATRIPTIFEAIKAARQGQKSTPRRPRLSIETILPTGGNFPTKVNCFKSNCSIAIMVPRICVKADGHTDTLTNGLIMKLFRHPWRFRLFSFVSNLDQQSRSGRHTNARGRPARKLAPAATAAAEFISIRQCICHSPVKLSSAWYSFPDLGMVAAPVALK